MALPSQNIRGLLIQNKSWFNKGQIIVNVSKGIEIDTLMTISEVTKMLRGSKHKSIVTLFGPSHAEEVIRRHPTTLVAVSHDVNSAKKIQSIICW